VGLWRKTINPLNAELNPICHFLGLLGAHHILHVSRIRVKQCYCYKYCEPRHGAPTDQTRMPTRGASLHMGRNWPWFFQQDKVQEQQYL
jgi:hypothetical protein